MDVVWMRARSLARRGWRATLLLALLAGLSAGVAIATLGAGRRTASAFDRLVEYADPPELLVNFCPEGIAEVTEESLAECFLYDPVAEQRQVLSLPEVEATVRGHYRGLTFAPSEHPEQTRPGSGVVMQDPGIQSVDGRQVVVDGRWYRDDADDEVVVTQRVRDITGLDIGDELTFTFWSAEELGAPIEPGGTFDGPQHRARIVGVASGILDMAATRSAIGEGEDIRIHAGPAFAEATPDAAGFAGLFVDTDDDTSEAAARARLDEEFEGRLFQTGDALGADETEPTREAIRYEAQAALALGGLIGLAATVFVGQAVARQSRREWADGPALRAIGVTRREAGVAAAVRGAAIAVPAAVVALLVGLALSPLGPIGVAARAEVDPGIRADWTVLGLGAAAVLTGVLLCAWVPVVMTRTLTTRPAAAPRATARVRASLPPTVAAGLRMGRRSGAGEGSLPLGTAFASVALAIGTLVAAVGLTSSLDSLFSNPERFGAAWDLSFGASAVGGDDVEAALEVVTSSPDVVAAAAITGTDVEIGGREIAWIHAFEPVEGIDRTVPLPITSGRAPGPGEIALGTTTMDDLDLELGDTVEVTTLTTGRSYDLVVVGTTIVNDNFEKSPGRGGVVPVEWMDEAAPEITSDPYVLDLRDGADVDAVAASLRERFGGIVTGPVPQEAIRNVDRIRRLPYLLAAVVSGLALASLVHALVLSVRRQRGQLAVLRALGFTGRQVRGTVAVHATSLALLAAAVGVPLGVILGRWGWRVVAEQIGVAVVPVTPPVALLLAALATVALSNLAAAYPAWRAARISAAEALRTE